MTGAAGLVAVTELVDRLGVVGALDDGIGPIKQRDRGLTGAELLVGMASSQLQGESALVGLDRSRADRAGAWLAPVPCAPSRTAARLAGRFGPPQLAGIERGLAVIARRMMRLLPAQRRAELVTGRPVLDCDSSDVEVYGRKKRGVAFTHDGRRAGRPLLVSWARTGLTLAADLLAGNQDPRPHVIALLRRALSVLPDAVCAPPVVRADSGFYSTAFMRAVVAAGGDFAISAPRSAALWRAYAQIPEDRWVEARDMRGAQVAAGDHAPEGAPPGTYTIVRRVKVAAGEVSADPRSRRGRTLVPGQRQLLLDGMIDHSWAVSFLVTSLPADEPGGIVAVEWWFRGRADIETRIKSPVPLGKPVPG
ncbi:MULTISPECIES: transposase [unclassified Pseudofrankia]|uniref:transposase n=1 Tax=unclassified Pseudofrankia TaxID=2994372 RepID=UPI0012FFADB7|nr:MULTISPECIES: transposase [unclassified Pseudofrankia]MDT3446270.1 transposase [Pseudofrankia sp. BMG5.37]